MRRIIFLLALIAGLASALAVRAADAATLRVAAGASDVLATDETCSLREAIINANGDAATWPDCSAGSGADTIVLPAGNYVLAIPGSDENAAATGDLDVTDELTLRGAGADSTIIDAAGIDRVLHSSAVLNLEGVTVTGGHADSGGGIHGSFLSLTHTTVAGNEAEGTGGGIFCFFATIAFTTISGNRAEGAGGGVTVWGGELTIRGSSVSENSAAPSGGGIYNLGGTVTLLNSTVSGNLGAGVTSRCVNTCCGRGSACMGGDTSIQNSTVSQNSGGGIANLSGHVTLKGSVIADQVSGADCTDAAITSHGHSLDSDGTCNLTDPTDLPNTDPMAGALQDNGGPTFTHALLPGSPAIDTIPLVDCTYDDDGDPGTPEVPLAEDQRRVARPQGDACDMGAYEVTACADSIDNDGDAFVDAADPGCRDAASVREDPQCQDGINNDLGQDGLIDFDGGLSALGYVATDPDPQCIGNPWKNNEFRQPSCGLGAELVLLLPPLMWPYRRRRRSSEDLAR